MKGLILNKVVLAFFLLLLGNAAWSQTDFRLSLNPPGNPIVFPSGGTSESLVYTIQNLGPLDEGDQTTLTINLNPAIEPAVAFSNDPNWLCTPSTSQIICDYTTIYPVGLTTSLQVNITPSQFDTIVPNAVSADLTNALGDSNPTDNSINTDINFVSAGSVDLSIDKTISPGSATTVAPGETISFDIAVTNLSSVDATNVVVMDDFVVNNLQFDAVNSSPDCQDLASFIECTATQIPAGNTVVFTVAATVGTSAQPGNYVNTASVSANEPDSDNTNNSNDQPFTIAVGGFPEVSVSKTVVGGATQIPQGTVLDYEIRVNNTGVGDALNVDLTDNLPPEVTYQSHQDFGNFSCTFAAPTISCSAASLPNTAAQDGVTIKVVATGAINSNVTNTASSTYADSNLTDNSSTFSFTVIAPDADLDLSMVADAASYTVGDLITLDLTVHNPFASTGEPPNTNVATTLPNEVVFNSAQVTNGAGWTCVHDGSTTGGVVTCDSNGNPVLIGTNTFIQITAVASGVATTVSPFASMTSDFDPNPSNDNASTGFEIFPGNADLSLQFVSASGVYDQGDAIVYDVQVANPMASTASPSDVLVDVTLPAEVIFNNTDLSAAPGWFCSHDGAPSGGVVLCDRQGSAFVSASTHVIKIATLATTPTTAAIAQGNIGSAADTVFANNSASQADVINAVNSDFSITKTVNTTDATVGDGFTYVLTVTNDPGSTASPSDVLIQDTLPAEVTYNSYVVGSNMGTTMNCTHDGSVTGGVFSCDTNGSPFAVNEVVTIDINVTAAAVNPGVVNTATVQTTADPDGISNNNSSSSSSVNISAPLTTPDYVLTMYSNPSEVVTGESFNHVAMMTNTGDFDLTDVKFDFAFSSQAQVLSVQAAGMTCVTSTSLVTCSNDQTMPTGEIYTVHYELISNEQSGIISSNVSVNADGVVKSANTVTQIISSSQQSDLALLKSASLTQVDLRGEFSYLFDVQNIGVSEQSNFSIVDELPADVVFQTYSGNQWTCSGSTTINCQYAGVLIPGEVTQLQIDVVAPENAGVITNTAVLEVVTDDDLSNNQSSANVSVVDGTGGGVAVADISIDLMANADELFNTDEVVWSIDVTNHGPDVATNIQLENTYPMGFEATEVLVDDGVSCVMLNSSLVCDLTSLGVDQTRHIELKGQFANGFMGLVMNVVEVNADSADPDSGNNQAHAQVNVIAAENLNADLSLEVLAESQEIRQGQSFQMTLLTHNLGPDQAFEAALSAEIGGLISDVQVLNSGQWLCQTSNHLLSCQFPGSYANGLQQNIDLSITTEQVVQTSQPITVNATIDSSAMDPHPGNNIAGLNNAVARTPTEGEIFALFDEAVGSGASDTVVNTIRNVSSYCARSYFMAIEGLCEEMIASARPENRENIIDAMEEMTPNEVIGQSTSATEIMASQFRNVSSRLSQLKGGGGSGFSVAGLTARYGNESIPLGMLAYLNQSEEESQNVSNINDFVSPWGFFVNGNISMGERDSTGRELGFDFDTYGLTAGVDYRFSPTKVAGVALGYANFDSEIEDEAEMKSTGFTLTGYGSFYIKDNFYVDARISYANPDFEQKRRINFNLDNIAIDRVATGKTNANQYTVAMSAGYHFNKNSWNITPNASVRYAETSIDAFRETGAGDFNFRFADQKVKSLVWSFGTSVSKAISLKNGVLSPQFDINISRETENDGGFVEAWFINAPSDEVFLIQTDEPDRTYGSAGLGLVFIGANGKQAYINYKSIFGLEGFTRGTINLGVRFEF